jgi:hypothetical protein
MKVVSINSANCQSRLSPKGRLLRVMWTAPTVSSNVEASPLRLTPSPPRCLGNPHALGRVRAALPASSQLLGSARRMR